MFHGEREQFALLPLESVYALYSLANLKWRSLFSIVLDSLLFIRDLTIQKYCCLLLTILEEEKIEQNGYFTFIMILNIYRTIFIKKKFFIQLLLDQNSLSK